MQRSASLRHAVVLVSAALAGWLLGDGAGSPAAADEVSFEVIVSSEVAGDAIARTALSAVFLSKSPRWGNGTPAVPVDQSTRAPVREVCSQRVHGRSLAAVMQYWMQQISNGRGVPPR